MTLVEESLENIENNINDTIERGTARHLNRAQRRALMKKTSKANRQQINQINETTKKLAYIDLIQKLRKLNKEKENDNNEDSTKDN